MPGIRVADFYPSCATRERGRKFYALLAPEVRAAVTTSRPFALSFHQVEYVSSSFLDETVVRLLEELPAASDVLRVEDLQPLALRSLETALAAKGLPRPGLPAHA